nr:hypothetical protein CFP56_30763 [Quercus suber]
MGLIECSNAAPADSILETTYPWTTRLESSCSHTRIVHDECFVFVRKTPLVRVHQASARFHHGLHTLTFGFQSGYADDADIVDCHAKGRESNGRGRVMMKADRHRPIRVADGDRAGASQ